MKKPPTETGGAAMDDLTRKLLRVPKAELDKQVQRHKEKKQKPKK